MAAGIVQLEPAPHVLEADAGAAAARLGRGLQRTGVLDGDVQRMPDQPDVDADLEAIVAHAVLNGVLDQGLQQEARDAALERRRLGLQRNLQPIAEARLLHAQIGRQPADLRLDRDHRLVDAVERMTQVGREVAQHGEGGRRMIGDLLGHAVQRIEQEMRVELQAQLLKLGAQRLGLGAHGVAVLGLLGELGMDPEVAKAPADQDERAVDQRQEELVDRVAIRDHPAAELATGEHRAGHDRRAADRQENHPGSCPGGQAIAQGVRGVDRPHARGDGEQARHEQRRAQGGDHEVMEDQPLADQLYDAKKAPSGELRPPEHRQTAQGRQRPNGWLDG